MRYVEAVLPQDLEYVDLWCASDIHRAHPCFDEPSWRRLLDTVAADPHAYLLVNGDLVEAALKFSKGNIYRTTMPPGDERRMVQSELEKVKSKILLITSGNHDRRAERETDENPAQLVAEHLGLMDRYEPRGAVLEVAFGTRHGADDKRTSFLLYIMHGAGGGRRPGGKINRIQEWSWVVDGIDAFVSGHVHDLVSRVEYRHRPDAKNKTIATVPVAYVISGAFLRYGDYAEEAGYTPGAVSVPILRLYAKGRRDASKNMEIILPTKIQARG